MTSSLSQLQDIVTQLRHSSAKCATSGIIRIFSSPTSYNNFLSFTQRLVRRLGGVNGEHATRACAATLGDFLHFQNRQSLLFRRISSGLVIRCRAFLGNVGIYPGSSSFCVHGLHTVCGHTIRERLAIRHCPFGRICANISGAIGHTIPLGMVHQVQSLSLALDPILSCTESLFVFSFCAQKVTFISVTCLGGGSLRGKILICHHRGAKRRLFVG